MKNQISKLYNAVSAPVAASRDALAERLQSVRDTASLLSNRTMHHIGYGQETLKDWKIQPKRNIKRKSKKTMLI